MIATLAITQHCQAVVFFCFLSLSSLFFFSFKKKIQSFDVAEVAIIHLTI
jgi:hypothetical protein